MLLIQPICPASASHVPFKSSSTASKSPHHFDSMVRSTIIVRASDALPLAASVDDEQVFL